MINKPFIFAACTAAIIAFSGTTFAQEKQEVSGRQLMTEQERLQHRESMRNAKTAEERQQIQKKQHELMRTRAEARGQTLRERPAGSKQGRGGLMTEQERMQHQQQMRNAKTPEERRLIQQKHQEMMQTRVKARSDSMRAKPNR